MTSLCDVKRRFSDLWQDLLCHDRFAYISWVDSKISEFKIHGKISFNESEDSMYPVWISQTLANSVRQRFDLMLADNSNKDKKATKKSLVCLDILKREIQVRHDKTLKTPQKRNANQTPRKNKIQGDTPVKSSPAKRLKLDHCESPVFSPLKITQKTPVKNILESLSHVESNSKPIEDNDFDSFFGRFISATSKLSDVTYNGDSKDSHSNHKEKIVSNGSIHYTTFLKSFGQELVSSNQNLTENSDVTLIFDNEKCPNQDQTKGFAHDRNKLLNLNENSTSSGDLISHCTTSSDIPLTFDDAYCPNGFLQDQLELNKLLNLNENSNSSEQLTSSTFTYKIDYSNWPIKDKPSALEPEHQMKTNGLLNLECNSTQDYFTTSTNKPCDLGIVNLQIEDQTNGFLEDRIQLTRLLNLNGNSTHGLYTSDVDNWTNKDQTSVLVEGHGEDVSLEMNYDSISDDELLQFHDSSDSHRC